MSDEHSCPHPSELLFNTVVHNAGGVVSTLHHKPIIFHSGTTWVMCFRTGGKGKKGIYLPSEFQIPLTSC